MAKVKCPRCEFVNQEGTDACSRCGSSLPRVRTGPSNPPAASPNTVVFRPGQVIAGRYTVIGMIGRGGMGCIYRVRDNVLQEDVALKTLLPQFAREKMVVDRFFNEARIARGLSHPNIVRVHDIGMAGELLYISMELIRGKSLRNILEQLAPGQRLPARTTLRVMDELCAALEYAHRHTVHRDIKPENVMVCEDGSVKLMDFGISKLMDARGLTSTSMIMGTPYYMSPEQQRDSANVDARADIYSLGVMLYEILTGNMPTGVPKPASQLRREVPPALDPIVAQCVDPNPAERYQSASELRQALQQISKLLESGVANDEAAARRAHARARNKRRAVGAVLVLILLALSAFSLKKAEEYRATRSLQVSEATPSPSVAQPQTSPFSDLEALAQKLHARAAEKAADSPVLKSAEEQWKHAQGLAATDAEGAYAEGLSAVQTYYAILRCPKNMVIVPAGAVSMQDGATATSVHLPPFLISARETSNDEFLQFCVATKWRPYEVLASAPPGLPVSAVTYYDAQAYAAWMGTSLGLEVTIPTEAQWMRAACPGKAEPCAFPWEGPWEADAANVATGTLAPTASFSKDLSWCGCYDMAGNISEWTRSIYRAFPYNPEDGREDPSAVWFGIPLVIRGGSFMDTAPIPLSQRRVHGFEQPPTAAMGFRCVAALPDRLDILAGAL